MLKRKRLSCNNDVAKITGEETIWRKKKQKIKDENKNVTEKRVTKMEET